jgi:hypothetical protein
MSTDLSNFQEWSSFEDNCCRIVLPRHDVYRTICVYKKKYGFEVRLIQNGVSVKNSYPYNTLEEAKFEAIEIAKRIDWI